MVMKELALRTSPQPNDAHVLEAEALSIGYLERLVVENLNLTIPWGKITALVGPNASGKSTILKTIARLISPRAGEVCLDGKAIHQQNTRAIAKSLAILTQGPGAPEGLTVRELVSYGRYPYRTGLGSLTEQDKQMINWALDVTGIHDLASRRLSSLSGGQRQFAWIAMALAQNTPFLLLDEPTTFLDMAHQIEVLELLRKLNVEEGRTIVIVVHDLNQASRYADYIVAILNGQIIAQGTPETVITPEMLAKVFQVVAHVIPDPQSGVPLCLPYELATETTAALPVSSA
jgi:iron complex transport system ATP-binding protein